MSVLFPEFLPKFCYGAVDPEGGTAEIVIRSTCCMSMRSLFMPLFPYSLLLLFIKNPVPPSLYGCNWLVKAHTQISGIIERKSVMPPSKLCIYTCTKTVELNEADEMAYSVCITQLQLEEIF